MRDGVAFLRLNEFKNMHELAKRLAYEIGKLDATRDHIMRVEFIIADKVVDPPRLRITQEVTK